MKGYDYLAEFLIQSGVTHIFYQELMFTKMIKKYEELGGKTILAHSEYAAGYMADGYARASMKPGITMGQSIGSANVAASLHDAWLGNSPVIAFTGRQVPDKLYRNAYQESDHRPIFDGVTKFNATVEKTSQLPLLVRQSFRETTSGKSKPAHLDINGFFGKECEEGETNETVLVNKEYCQYPSFKIKAEEKYIDMAVEAIEKAEKPLILAGRGALIAKAHKELYKFAAFNDIPICTSPDGKTIIDEQDPLWAGIIGNYGMFGTNRIARECDLFIIIGSQTGDQTTMNYTAPSTNTPVIQIDIDPTEIGRNYPNCIPLYGDAKEVLKQLTNSISKRVRTNWRKKATDYLNDTIKSHEKLWDDDSSPITTGFLCKKLSDCLPDDGVLVGDTGWPCVWSSTMVRMKHTQFYTRAAGSLGWSFPASIGVKCALPDRPVICFIGDGGMFYYSNEIETAVRYNIPIVCVINNNRSLAQVIPFMAETYVGEEERCINRNSFDSEFSFAEIASNFGAWSKQVTDPKMLTSALNEALDSGRPAVVEVMTKRCAPCGPESDEIIK